MLSCRIIGSRSGPPCAVPQTEVSNARQISVLVLSTRTLPHLIFVYENSSQKATVRHGHTKSFSGLAQFPNPWSWDDLTGNLSLLAQDNQQQFRGGCSSFLFNTTVAALTCLLSDAQNSTVNSAMTTFFSITEATTLPMLSCSSAAHPTHQCMSMS